MTPEEYPDWRFPEMDTSDSGLPEHATRDFVIAMTTAIALLIGSLVLSAHIAKKRGVIRSSDLDRAIPVQVDVLRSIPLHHLRW